VYKVVKVGRVKEDLCKIEDFNIYMLRDRRPQKESLNLWERIMDG
jgi:hypothetical protein